MLTFEHKEAVSGFLKLCGINPGRPNLELLAKLQDGFARMPYENFTKIIRDHKENDPLAKLRLPDHVLCEHLEYGAGGTCFSLTYFFQSILKACEFETSIAMADRSYGTDTHCASIVTLEGRRYLVDPGFCLSTPIALDAKDIDAKHNRITLARVSDNALTLATTQTGQTKVRYTLKTAETKTDEFLSHWLDSFTWPMMRNACITKVSDDGYIFMRGSFVRLNTKQSAVKTNIPRDDIKDVSKIFGLNKNIIDEANTITGEALCHQATHR